MDSGYLQHSELRQGRGRNRERAYVPGQTLEKRADSNPYDPDPWLDDGPFSVTLEVAEQSIDT